MGVGTSSPHPARMGRRFLASCKQCFRHFWLDSHVAETTDTSPKSVLASTHQTHNPDHNWPYNSHGCQWTLNPMYTLYAKPTGMAYEAQIRKPHEPSHKTANHVPWAALGGWGSAMCRDPQRDRPSERLKETLNPKP